MVSRFKEARERWSEQKRRNLIIFPCAATLSASGDENMKRILAAEKKLALSFSLLVNEAQQKVPRYMKILIQLPSTLKLVWETFAYEKSAEKLNLRLEAGFSLRA